LFYQQFCFGPGDEHCRAHFEHQAHKLLLTQDVGQGFTSQQAFCQFIQLCFLGGGKVSFGMRQHPGFFAPQDMRQQDQTELMGELQR
jgi:hypothetical protein